jgi:hypothetical protein
MAVFFRDADSAAEYQVQREVLEALRVQQMPADQFSVWLKENWGHLQRQGNPSLADGSEPAHPVARCFFSQEEKNAYDEAMETARAMRIASLRGLL